MLGKCISTLKLLEVHFPRPESGLPCLVVQVGHWLRGPRRGQEGAEEEPLVHSPGIQVSPGAGNFSSLHKGTGGAGRALAELTEGEAEVREAPLRSRPCGVSSPSLCNVPGPLAPGPPPSEPQTLQPSPKGLFLQEQDFPFL